MSLLVLNKFNNSVSNLLNNNNNNNINIIIIFVIVIITIITIIFFIRDGETQCIYSSHGYLAYITKEIIK